MLTYDELIELRDKLVNQKLLHKPIKNKETQYNTAFP